MSRLDAASLHHALRQSGTPRHYFAETAAVRAELLERLTGDLRADGFTPYLLHNTTSGLLATLLGAASTGQVVRTCGSAEQHYPGYTKVLPTGDDPSAWELRTHVSPLTGAVDPLDGQPPQIVDAAQSLGTNLTSALLRAAAVVLAPLHKHLGLAVGLGLVLVRDDLAELEPVRMTLDVAQTGAQSLDLLRAANTAATKADGRIFNRAEVGADQHLDNWCRDRGLRLRAHAQGVPYVCLTTTDASPVTARLAPTQWRHFRSHNTARFSFHRPGSATDHAVDCTDDLKTAVSAALDRLGRHTA